MKSGRQLNIIAQQLLDEQSKKHDYIVNTNALTMTAQTMTNGHNSERFEHRLVMKMPAAFTGDSDFDITNIMHHQLGEWLNIPQRYYTRMQAEAPKMLADNVNHWLHTSNQPRMLRTLGTTARAFLSNRYRPLDNADLMQAIMPVLDKSKLNIVSSELTDRRLYIKAVAPKIQGEIKQGDIVQAGVVISNSEVGSGALQIRPMIYRLICANGMIRSDDRMRQIHAGTTQKNDATWELLSDATKLASDKAVFMQAKDIVAAYLTGDYFNRILENLRAAATDKISSSNLMKVVEVTSRTIGLTESEESCVLTHLAADGDLTRWGLANAVTRTAQNADTYDRATELEQLGFNVIELSQTNWTQIAAAA